MKTIKGQQITKIHTRGTMYDNQCVSVYDNKKNHYLMRVEEILAIDCSFNQVTFNIIQKRKHQYLEVA